MHPSNKTTQLVWMVIVAPIYLVSNFWMTSPISKKKSLDNSSLVERITTIGYYFFCLSSKYFLFEQNDVLDTFATKSM